MKEKVQGLYEHDRQEREKLKEKIVDAINGIESIMVLEYLYNFIKAAATQWE